MHDCIHLRNSYIKFNQISHYKKLVNELNEIDNFLELFDYFEVEPDIKKNDSYELTYHKSDLSVEQIMKLINDIIELCDQYENVLTLTIKIIDDGSFMLYCIITDNVINDVTNKINKYMLRKEKNIFIH